MPFFKGIDGSADVKVSDGVSDEGLGIVEWPDTVEGLASLKGLDPPGGVEFAATVAWLLICSGSWRAADVRLLPVGRTILLFS